jgi:hypothetical protein
MAKKLNKNFIHSCLSCGSEFTIEWEDGEVEGEEPTHCPFCGEALEDEEYDDDDYDDYDDEELDDEEYDK